MTNETAETATQTYAVRVEAGQTIRFTGGHTIRVARVRFGTGDDNTVYIYAEGDNGSPYALPADAMVYRIETPTSATVAIHAVRELAWGAARLLDTDKRDAAITALYVLIDLSSAEASVKTRMRETTRREISRTGTAHV